VRSDLEVLRIIAAFGIVWFHSGYAYGRDLAYAGLVVFLILSTYFSTKSLRTHSLGERALRLIVPCILWSALYGAINFMRNEPIFPSNYSLFSKILVTPSIHLWYLPFVFFCIIFIDKVKQYIDSKTLAIFTAIVASTLLLISPQWRQWEYVVPLGQYIHALPAILIGMLLALSQQLSSSMKYLLIGLVFLSAIYIFWVQIAGVSVTYLVGISGTLLLLKDKSILPKNNVIIELSRLTFGIFLVHPLIIFVLRHIGFNSILLPVLSFIASAICIYTVFKVTPKPILKYVV
jgi:peptidoglycan/LPS O-acetylase OafA/YrhL